VVHSEFSRSAVSRHSAPVLQKSTILHRPNHPSKTVVFERRGQTERSSRASRMELIEIFAADARSAARARWHVLVG
jgi:hypothetical protein